MYTFRRLCLKRMHLVGWVGRAVAFELYKARSGTRYYALYRMSYIQTEIHLRLTSTGDAG